VATTRVPCSICCAAGYEILKSGEAANAASVLWMGCFATGCSSETPHPSAGRYQGPECGGRAACMTCLCDGKWHDD
jgi:hypothetical protein